MAKPKEESLLDLPVQFGGTSSGKKTVRVGITVDREHLKLPKADSTLCDRRLTVTIFANAQGDQPGQKRLPGMEDDLELTGVADVKAFSVHSTTITFGLTFNRAEVRKATAKKGVQFSDFSAREGRLMIADVSDIPEPEKSEPEEEPTDGDEE